MSEELKTQQPPVTLDLCYCVRTAQSPGGGGVLPYMGYKAAICLPSTLIRHENGTFNFENALAEKFESAGFAFLNEEFPVIRLFPDLHLPHFSINTTEMWT